jgi:NAD dependent epimerase/dehydratase
MPIEAKRVLVTGADGFIGSHLAEMLCATGTAVRALCLYNSLGHWGWLENSPRNNDMEIIAGDIRDPDLVRGLVAGVDVVFHLAALIAIPYSYRAPDSYVQTNVIGTLNLLQASLAAGVTRFIQTSTSEVYGTARYVPIDEVHPLQPQSPYSASKIAADALAMSFWHSFQLPVTVARPFNTYGPRQSARAVIPTVVTQLLTGARDIKLGSLTPTRDLNFVEDTCRGLLAVGGCAEAVGETINIGSGREISIGDLTRRLIALVGSKAQVVLDERRLRPGGSEVERLCCDNGKIARLTGFAPQIALEDGLEQTITWFRDPENLKRYKANVYNV